ncbi:hypothetical protein M3P05_20210 [Sansalvadorimonas sp. 2012CJ34-2]|uniref:Uncharacterized protein n=1 Tax=Parendozoicomonas callyspongiae TaxID=2942213 RepID=A0ABT0PP81_9GAMM|nr:hypothetical protein [Sansalvadorimonas sp. 2012CJ34-2]MCL6272248.1 hypothetical protein [Sansalvadorimonas sp. 2012CJ34-2]
MSMKKISQHDLYSIVQTIKKWDCDNKLSWESLRVQLSKTLHHEIWSRQALYSHRDIRDSFHDKKREIKQYLLFKNNNNSPKEKLLSENIRLKNEIDSLEKKLNDLQLRYVQLTYALSLQPGWSKEFLDWELPNNTRTQSNEI